VTSGRHIVTFEPIGVRVEVTAGTTVRDAAAAAGVPVAAPCGGLGTCGRCTVTVRGVVEPPTTDELTLLAGDRIAMGVRLACRVRISGDVAVTLAESGAPEGIRVVDAASAVATVVEPPALRGIEAAGPLLGAAVDIGTTTLAVRLVDLRTGASLGSASALNPQHVFGHDVMSRISAASASGVEALQRPLAAAIESLLAGLLDSREQSAGALREIALCGNPTMVHLALGIDPSPLGEAPYEPRLKGSVTQTAAAAGLDAFAPALLYVLPGISAFVGADVVAGVLATEIDRADGIRMLLDLGTNGEIVLRTPNGMLATSAAAGPALEGATISAGMFATDGAVERVELAGDGLAIGVIGGPPARGLCGSGLLDLIAALLDAGIMDASGRIREDAAHALATRVSETDGVRVFEVAPGVSLTQHDVRQVQLAIAAFAAGIGELLDAAGVGADDVAELVVAGGFGLHVGAHALARMGVIPRAWVGIARFAGNTALAGTAMALLDSDARRRADAVAHHTQTIDLATRATFQTRFIGAMTFPQS